ncbi:uncharacterized protein JN550_006991 [Neoarthrinium moseri]|uniref:uncharacterized protein n=1 Tax=Neoarthrinium moseri TaxID=1658444 RepID=UPI001FDE7D8B|nr:uncharacterized protein JN550_006991 [Neoarthrinium moseri]KAI1867260.1 hypothetical protein JN550_006991 [Neoarthrinium moseri]
MSKSDSKVPVERRASMRTSMRLSVAPGEDDDYDMQVMGISDGFRPTNVAQDHISDPAASPQPTPATQAKPQRPSSIAKPPQSRESLSLRHDGGMGPEVECVAASSSSNVNDIVGASIVRSESPYQGPSGPSFPYQMYPQDVRVARTASIATTSTVPTSERSYNGPNNPTHPYQMYPQGTVPTVDNTEERATPVAIPVGFGGAMDNYQRRLGPDGEEIADMIGPDGHTEQLPPYTRYPDEAYQRKIAGIGGMPVEPSPAESSSATASTRMESIPGAGGLGLATRNPEFASTEDLPLQGATSPHSRQSLRSVPSDASSQHEVNTAARAVIDEKKPLKNWQVAAKRKVWGVVPCWALTLTVIIVVMLAVVLGTVLGIFFNKPKRPPPNDSSSPTMTFDATPLPTVPAGLEPLPGGKFALPLTVTRTPATCFNDSTQAQAWNCNQVFAQLTMEIMELAHAPDTSQYSMSIDYNTSYTIEDNQYSYGMQPPSVQDIQLLLVTDVNEPARGPAWAFEVTYDKTVILPETLFPTPTSTAANAKRSPPPPPPPGGFRGGDFHRKGLAEEGDKPWICTWQGTILEVFVYPNQNNSQPSDLVNFSGFASSTSTTSTPVTSTSTTTTPTSTGSTFEWSPSDFRNGFATTKAERRDPTTTTPPPTTATATSTTTGLFDTSKPVPSDFRVPFFPRVVKMEERRVPEEGQAPPSCRQYQINSNGPATPLKDSKGNFIEVTIVENEAISDPSRKRKQRYVGRHVIQDYLDDGIKRRDSSDMSNCGCMWWAT